MKIIRFAYKKKKYWGVIKGDDACILRDTPFARITYAKGRIPLKKITLLAPTEPSKVILVGLNYRDHAKELSMKLPQEPIIFLKPPTTVIGPNDHIIYPRSVKRLDYEAELALVIKRKAAHINIADVSRYVLGYTCLNDVTARDLQKQDGQWTRAKSFDTFCPIGPWIETRFSANNVRIRSLVNGTVKQDSTTKQFIFSVPELVAYISSIMTLYPGDVISTGTPSGIGPMDVGDRVRIEIDGIGVLENTVI